MHVPPVPEPSALDRGPLSHGISSPPDREPCCATCGLLCRPPVVSSVPPSFVGVTETTRKGNSDDDHLAQNRQYHVSCLGSRARRGVLYPDAWSAQNVGGSGTAHDGLHLCRE